MRKIKSSRILRTSLHKSYIDLLTKSFEFIKVYFLKNKNIHPKRDPMIYGSLVCECSLTDMKNKNNFLRKLFLKLQQSEFYEDYLVSRELLQLLFLPCFMRMEYYILLQHHVLENGAIIQIDLKAYFKFVDKEFKSYIKSLSEAYNLKKFQNLSYLNFNTRFVNRQVKDFTKNRQIKVPYQEVQEFKHKSLGIQLMLLKKISKVETKKEIKKWSYALTCFVCKPDELFCGYV